MGSAWSQTHTEPPELGFDEARMTLSVLSRGSPPRLSQEHSCVINIGVGKNLDMLNILINFLDPVFSDHLSECPPLPPDTSPNQGMRGRGPGTQSGSFGLSVRPREEGSSGWGWSLERGKSTSNHLQGQMGKGKPRFPHFLSESVCSVVWPHSVGFCFICCCPDPRPQLAPCYLSPQKARVLGPCSPSSPGSASAFNTPSSPLMTSGGSGR